MKDSVVVLTSSGVSLAAGASAPTTDNRYFSCINRGLFSAKSVSMIRAAASYQLGLFQFGAAYSNVEYGEGSLSADTHFNNATLYVNYKAFPATTLGVGYNFTKGDGGAQTDATYNQGFCRGKEYEANEIDMPSSAYIAKE